MKRKRDYRRESIEKVKLRQPKKKIRKKGEIFIKIRNKSIFFSLSPEHERERETEREKERIRSQAKQETRIINDFSALIWRQGALARKRGGGAS